MKTMTYVIAALAAVGIAVLVATFPSFGEPEAGDRAASAAATQLVSIAEADGELTLAVPDMHCQYSCFPRVEKTLAATDGIESVELAQQPTPDELTNRQVVVHYRKGFDLNAALANLEAEGFRKASVVQ